MLRLIGIVLVGWLVFWWWTEDERENNRHINKAIYPAFRTVEAQCLSERFPHETVRCKGVLKLLEQCTGTDSSCSASEYYSRLMELGFDLPPFYEPGHKPK